MSLVETAYTLALATLRPALRLAGVGEGKFARGVRGRRGVLRRIAAWAPNRDATRPLVWFHAPSVGEGLQARAVMEALLRERPDAQLVHTFFSPSAEPLARSLPVDLADYLPIDLPGEVGRALDLIRPDVIAFSKSDVWPNLTREAARRGIRLALLSGTVPAGSSRLAAPARTLLRPAYARLDRAAAISAADAERLRGLGVRPAALSVMGDAHFDRVLARVDASDPDSALLRPLRAARDAAAAGPTLVAGSTWPPDEERLVAALLAARAGGVPLRLVLVPHEPTPEHLADAEARLARGGLRAERLSLVGERWDGDAVLLVDRLGVLGHLYALADVAYVGGGWGTAGLHSVLEPAAFGLPVLFGPRHANAREAGELVSGGGAISVSKGEELTVALLGFLRDDARRRSAGAAARAYVEAGRGAAARGAALLAELIETR